MPDTVRIVGAPTDYGASRRGVDMGPSAIRYADLAAALSVVGLDPQDDGDLPVTRVERNVALVGVRDLDPGERETIRDHGVAAFSISEVDDRGITAVVDDALDAASGRDGVHVSLDLDWLDPTEAPGVGTPVGGGVTYREAHAALERVADAAAVRSLEPVDVTPILDDHNRTAGLAVELAASALGKRIL
jgi:arginase